MRLWVTIDVAVGWFFIAAVFCNYTMTREGVSGEWEKSATFVEPNLIAWMLPRQISEMMTEKLRLYNKHSRIIRPIQTHTEVANGQFSHISLRVIFYRQM